MRSRCAAMVMGEVSAAERSAHLQVPGLQATRVPAGTGSGRLLPLDVNAWEILDWWVIVARATCHSIAPVSRETKGPTLTRSALSQ